MISRAHFFRHRQQHNNSTTLAESKRLVESDNFIIIISRRAFFFVRADNFFVFHGKPNIATKSLGFAIFRRSTIHSHVRRAGGFVSDRNRLLPSYQHIFSSIQSLHRNKTTTNRSTKISRRKLMIIHFFPSPDRWFIFGGNEKKEKIAAYQFFYNFFVVVLLYQHVCCSHHICCCSPLNVNSYFAISHNTFPSQLSADNARFNRVSPSFPSYKRRSDYRHFYVIVSSLSSGGKLFFLSSSSPAEMAFQTFRRLSIAFERLLIAV